MPIMIITIVFSLCLMRSISCECVQSQPLVGGLSDDRFSASLPNADNGHSLSNAKLSSGDAWCSQEITDISVSPYLQVNFSHAVEIHSITVGGHTALLIYSEYIQNYQIIYRPIGEETLQFVLDADSHPEIFPRQSNVDPQEVTLLNPIITADILRIQVPPQSWSSSYDRVCLTLEAYGCIANISEESTLVYSSAVITPFTTLSSMPNNPILVTSSILLYMSSTHDDSSSVFDEVPTSTSSSTVVITVISSTSTIDITMLTMSSSSSSVNTSSQGQNSGTDYNTTYIISGAGVAFLVMLTIIIISAIACIIFIRQSKSKGKILNNEFYGLSMEGLNDDKPQDKVSTADAEIDGNYYEAIHITSDHKISYNKLTHHTDEVLKVLPPADQELPTPPACNHRSVEEYSNVDVDTGGYSTQDILMSPNPLYGNHKPNDVADINNPLYSHEHPNKSDNAPCDKTICKTNEDYERHPVITNEDMLDNPLYGGR